MPRALIIFLAVALAAAGLRAQAGHLDIGYVQDPDKETFIDVWNEGGNTWVVGLPFAVRLSYSDTPPGTAGSAPVARSMVLLADRALIWFEPDAGNQVKVGSDPFLAMRSGVKNLQFYGEGHVWMRYSSGVENLTLRADRVYLDFSRGRVTRYDAKGEATEHELLNLRGRMDNVKGHSGADDMPENTPPGPPLRVGLGTGNAADEAREADRQGAIGASPSDSAVPEPAGRVRALPQEQGVRLFMRARQLRIVNLNPDEQEIELDNGSISSSSLAVASYSLAAEALTIRLTPVRQTVYVTRPSLRVLDYPLLVFAFEDYAYDLDSSPPIRQLDLGRSSQYGYWIRTYIDAIASYDLLWDPEPPFRPLQLGPQLDYFTDRGFGSGLNLDWGGMRPFDEFARVGVRSYYINDRGDRRQRARELGWYPLEKNGRGRMQAMYSQNFGAGWQLDHLFNYNTDLHFRREFYEREYDSNEPLDTFILLTRRSGPLNFFLHIEPRVHPWQNKTEYLPTLGFDVSRASVGDFGLQMSSHAEISQLMYRPADGDDRRRISATRADVAVWFNAPMDMGLFTFDPFFGARATGSNHFLEIPEDAGRPDLSPDGTFPGMREGDQRRSGVLARALPFVGANVQTFVTGTFPDFRVPWLGIDGLRHVFAPFARYRNVFYNSLDDIPDRAFIPFDHVDTLDEFHEVRVGFRNRLQTRTGRGNDRRTTDYFEIMAELPIYPHRRRDNGGILYGDLEVAASWRPMPGLALAGNMYLDPLTGNYNRASGSLRFDRLEVGQVSLYYRMLKGQHQVVGIQLDLTLSELYRVGARQEYDLQKGEFRDTRIELTRRVLEAVDLGFVFARDAVEGDIGFYFSISAAFRAPKGGSSLLR